MRKTKILKRLVAISFAIALALSGVVPGMKPLEAQAKKLSSTQITTAEIYEFFNDNDFESIILGQNSSISFLQDTTLFIDDESTEYTSGSTWTNNTAQEYHIYQLSYDSDVTVSGNISNLSVYLEPCSFSGDYSIQVWFDVSFEYGTKEQSAFTFKLGNSTTMSKDEIIAGMYNYFPSGFDIKDNKLYINNSCTEYYSDIVDVTSRGWASFNSETNTYDWILDAFVLVGRKDTGNSSGSPAPTPIVSQPEESSPVAIPETPETHYGTFQADAITKVQTALANINNAAKNNTSSNEAKSVNIDTGIWVSFNRQVYEEIEKSNVPVTITFIYENVRYTVTIPAYAKVTSLVDENGYCGFLNLGAHYGYDKIEKL